MWYHAAAVGITAILAVPLTRARPSAPAPSSTCALVRGHIDANVDGIRPTVSGLKLQGRGHSRGDLAGAITVTVLKPFGTRPLEVTFEILTPRGVAAVQGSAVAMGDTHERAIVARQLNVQGGTGAYAESSGRLEARGTADTRARVLSIDYDGRICVPANELIQTRDGHQNRLDGRA